MDDVAQQERATWDGFTKHWLECPQCSQAGDGRYMGAYCPEGRKLFVKWVCWQQRGADMPTTPGRYRWKMCPPDGPWVWLEVLYREEFLGAIGGDGNWAPLEWFTNCGMWEPRMPPGFTLERAI